MKGTKNNKNSRIVLSILGTSTFVITLFGAVFSYHSIGNNKGLETAITKISKTAELNFYNVGDLTLSDALPGDTTDLIFKIENPSVFEGKKNISSFSYDVDFITVLDEFASSDDNVKLYMSVKEKTDGNSILGVINDQYSDKKTYILSKNIVAEPLNVVKKQVIEPGETQTFIVTLTYPEMDENIVQNKSFSGHFEINNIKKVEMK